MTFAIVFRTAARRELLGLPKKIRQRILGRLSELAGDPWMRGTEPLTGDLRGRRKMRAGDYRVVYSVDGEALLVEVITAGHRSRVYSVSSRR